MILTWDVNVDHLLLLKKYSTFCLKVWNLNSLNADKHM